MSEQIYEILKKDHVLLAGLIDQLVSLEKKSPERHKLITQIQNELIPHARAEEMVFYNCLREIEPTKEIANHGFKEHFEVEALLRTLQVQSRIEADWKETAENFQRAIDHHILEEEAVIFPAARQVITSEEAVMIGEAFVERKAKVSKQGVAKNTFDLMVNLLPPRFADTLRRMSA